MRINVLIKIRVIMLEEQLNIILNLNFREIKFIRNIYAFFQKKTNADITNNDNVNGRLNIKQLNIILNLNSCIYNSSEN